MSEKQLRNLTVSHRAFTSFILKQFFTLTLIPVVPDAADPEHFVESAL